MNRSDMITTWMCIPVKIGRIKPTTHIWRCESGVILSITVVFHEGIAHLQEKSTANLTDGFRKIPQSQSGDQTVHHLKTGWWCNFTILKNDGLRQWVSDDIPFF